MFVSDEYGQADRAEGRRRSLADAGDADALIDLNDKADLARFGLRNGAPNDQNNLSEKWEAMGLVSVLDPNLPDDYFLFVSNDNDFLTQDGFQVGAAYKADGGADVDTMFQVTLPGLKK